LANPPPPSPAANFSSPSASSFSLPAEKVFLRFAFAVALLLCLIAIAHLLLLRLLLPGLRLPNCCCHCRYLFVVIPGGDLRLSFVVIPGGDLRLSFLVTHGENLLLSFAFASAVVCTLSSEPKNRHFDEATHSLNVRSAMEKVPLPQKCPWAEANRPTTLCADQESKSKLLH
jgi:hypothetical protein